MEEKYLKYHWRQFLFDLYRYYQYISQKKQAGVDSTPARLLDGQNIPAFLGLS